MGSKTSNRNIEKLLKQILEKLRAKPIPVLRVKDIEISESFMEEENQKKNRVLK